jgi:hypothetical protein
MITSAKVITPSATTMYQTKKKRKPTLQCKKKKKKRTKLKHNKKYGEQAP